VEDGDLLVDMAGEEVEFELLYSMTARVQSVGGTGQIGCEKAASSIATAYLILKSVDLVLSTFTHNSIPLDIRLFLCDSSGSDTLRLGVDLGEVGDVHGVNDIGSQEVPRSR